MGILTDLRDEILEKDRLKKEIALTQENQDRLGSEVETGAVEVKHNKKMGLDAGMPHLERAGNRE